jgi:hypothetical protein
VFDHPLDNPVFFVERSAIDYWQAHRSAVESYR